MSKIKNFQQLATTDLRQIALELAETGLEAIDTRQIILEKIKLEDKVIRIEDKVFSLESVNRLVIVGIGKCALQAAAALEQVLGDLITEGVIIDTHQGKLKKIKTYVGSHPFPSQNNIDATAEIIKLLKDLKENDLVIFVVSGGGSTLLCQPENLTCQAEKNILEYLFKVGATIQEINTIRKHLSLARGGYLAQYAYPARVISLIFSDVVGNNLEFVASGPTVKDTTTVEDAKRIFTAYNLEAVCGGSLTALIETPKDNKYFEKVENILLLTNKVGLEAMAAKAKSLGFSAKVVTAELVGEAREVGLKVIDELRGAKPKTVLLYGGETTVNVVGNGIGGRNLELVLSALRLIKDKELVLAFDSDGRDNTDFAGALCDIMTQAKAERMLLNPFQYLKENRSFDFFRQVGDYLLTGETGSNVADFVMALHE